MGGLSYLGRRILQTIPVLFGISLVSFFLIHLIPGDPVQAMLGNHYTPKAAAALRHSLGLDASLPEQYFLFLKNLLHGNLGQSVYYQQPVTDVMVTGGRVNPGDPITNKATLSGASADFSNNGNLTIQFSGSTGNISNDKLSLTNALTLGGTSSLNRRDAGVEPLPARAT